MPLHDSISAWRTRTAPAFSGMRRLPPTHKPWPAALNNTAGTRTTSHLFRDWEMPVTSSQREPGRRPSSGEKGSSEWWRMSVLFSGLEITTCSDLLPHTEDTTRTVTRSCPQHLHKSCTTHAEPQDTTLIALLLKSSWNCQPPLAKDFQMNMKDKVQAWKETK